MIFFMGAILKKMAISSKENPLRFDHFSSSIVFDDNNDDFQIRSGEKSKFCPRAGEELGYACSGPAVRARWGPGIGHGREIFPYGTSSHTHGDDDENFSSMSFWIRSSLSTHFVK